MPDLIAELEQLKGYSYQLWRYQVSHCILIIRATHRGKPNHNVEITFNNVAYIQMPTMWTGDFRLADTEFFDVTQKCHFRDSTNDLLRTIYSLFKADYSNGVVYILGHLAKIKYDVEPIY